jgi:hypothetical protein
MGSLEMKKMPEKEDFFIASILIYLRLNFRSKVWQEHNHSQIK